MKKIFIYTILFLLAFSISAQAQTTRNTKLNHCSVKYYPVSNGFTKKYAVYNSAGNETVTITQGYVAGTREFTEKAVHSSNDTTLGRKFRCMSEGIRSLDLAQVMSSNTDFKFETSNDTGLTMPSGNLGVGQNWTTGYDLTGNFNVAAGQNRSQSKGEINSKTTGTANAANQVLAIGEKVTVPGGTFTAAKIKTVFTIQINVLNAELIEKMQGLKLPMGNMKSKPTTMTVIQWFSPRVGLIKSEFSTSFGSGRMEYLGGANAPDVDDTTANTSDGDGTKNTSDDTQSGNGDDDTTTNSGGSGGGVKTDKIRLCIIKASAKLEGVNAERAADGIQNAFAELLDSRAIEVIRLEETLTILAKREAADKQCDYTLKTEVIQKKGKRGGGMFGRILEGATDRAITSGASRIPYGGNVGEAVARDAAVRAAYEVAALNLQVSKKDKFTLECQLFGKNGQSVWSAKIEEKADKDGDDVLSPMIENAANQVAEKILN